MVERPGVGRGGCRRTREPRQAQDLSRAALRGVSYSAMSKFNILNSIFVDGTSSKSSPK